ncbi:MAG: hypothetical protein KDB21_17935 [Acidimicrobiales bacterium]|nr:hypothetical protein [Acidimicrobiales bacterium]
MSLEGRIAALEAQLQELKAELATQRDESTVEAATPRADVIDLRDRADAPAASASRRQVLRRAGIAAAGAVAAGTALAVSQAAPAAADDPDDLTLGAAKSTSGFTLAEYTGTDTGAPFVFRTGSSGSNSDAFYPASLGGFTTGVHGVASGVYGYARQTLPSDPDGYGVVGVGDYYAAGVLARSSLGANLEIHADGVSGPARATPHKVGSVVCDTNGNLWFCAASGSPGTWRKMSGPATSGQLHLLAVPVRAYDSRSSSGPASTGQGPLASGSSRIVSLASGFIGATGTTAVPSGAVGALVNIAAVNTSNRGFLAVFNASEDWPGHANLNWDASGAVVSNQATSLVDNLRRVEVQAGGADASADFVIDVVGYYM